MTKKILTLVHLYNPEKILLGLKKRGFGKGLWNGFGGKVQPSESIEVAALRELEEEAGVRLDRLEAAGKAVFYFDGSELEIHYFRHHNFSGEAIETEEMRPRWFRHSKIPFNQMWPADKLYLPKLLTGHTLDGVFWLNDDKTVARHDIRLQ